MNLAKLIINKSELIIDVLKSSCQNIRRELKVVDRKALLNTLKEMPEEQLVVAFDVLHRIDNEESRKATCSKILYELTYDVIKSKIEEELYHADRMQRVNIPSLMSQEVEFTLPSRSVFQL